MEEGSPDNPIETSPDRLAKVLRDDAALAPAISLSRYVTLATGAIARAPMAWTYRALGLPFASFGALVPTLIGSYFLWLLAMPPEGRAHWLGEDPSADALLAPYAESFGARGLVVMLVLLVGMPALRGVFDALLYGQLVDGFTRRHRDAGAILRESWLGFFGLGLLQLGLCVGGIMFLSPVLAVVARVLVHHAGQLGPDVFLVICVILCMSTFAAIRTLVQLIAAHLAWRPRYVAGAIAAALAAPYSQRRIYAPLLGAWLLGFAAFASLASLLGASVVPLAIAGADVSNTAGVVLGVVGGAAVVFVSWYESVMLAMVGQRLGDIDDGTKQETRDVGLEPPVRGVYGPPSAAPVAQGARPPGTPRGAYFGVTSFEALFGYTPTLDPLDGWSSGVAALDALPRVAFRRAPSGGNELVVVPDAVEPTPRTQRPPPGRLAGVEPMLDRKVLRTEAGGREVALSARAPSPVPSSRPLQ